VLCAALFVVIGAVAVSRILDLGTANTVAEHTLVVRAEAEALMSLLKDAETGERGYLITGQQEYMQPFDDAVAALPKRIENFRRLTADNPRQQQNITMFEQLVQRRLTTLRRAMKVRQEAGAEGAADIVRGGEGKRIMDAARDVVAQMVAEEDRLWREQGLEQREQATRAAAVSVGALAIAFVLLVVATLYVVRAPRTAATRN
jgi:CHASE3 domain sensor protein